MSISTIERLALGFAGLSGAAAVTLGAWAAHGLEAVVGPAATELVRTGVSYQLWHVLALLLAAAMAGRSTTPRIHFAMTCAATGFALGQILFCGSLYALAFGLPRFLGAVAPLGGLAFILGWLCLFFAAIAGSSRRG